MPAPIGERQSGTGDEIVHRSRQKDFAGLGYRLDPRGDVHGDASDVSRRYFTLSGVEPDADLQTEGV